MLDIVPSPLPFSALNRLSGHLCRFHPCTARLCEELGVASPPKPLLLENAPFCRQTCISAQYLDERAHTQQACLICVYIAEKKKFRFGALVSSPLAAKPLQRAKSTHSRRMNRDKYLDKLKETWRRCRVLGPSVPPALRSPLLPRSAIPTPSACGKAPRA